MLVVCSVCWAEKTWTVSVGGRSLTDRRYGTVAFDISALRGCTKIGYRKPPCTARRSAASPEP